MANPSDSPTPKNGAERRLVPRFNMALDVAFNPIGEEAARPASGPPARTVTVNISQGGLCLYSDKLYPLGAQPHCALSVPGHPEPLELVGTVVWFQKVDRDAHGYKLGLEFKPLTPAQRAVLDTLFARPPAAVQTSGAKRLLLVDDDAELARAMQLRFEASGFEVVTAADGLEALRMAREHRPDVMILDLMLPHLNGYEVCRLLKFDQKFKGIPIILCTARSRQEDIKLGQSVGADAYVTKPFDGKGLIAKAEELLTPHSR